MYRLRIFFVGRSGGRKNTGVSGPGELGPGSVGGVLLGRGLLGDSLGLGESFVGSEGLGTSVPGSIAGFGLLGSGSGTDCKAGWLKPIRRRCEFLTCHAGSICVALETNQSTAASITGFGFGGRGLGGTGTDGGGWGPG